jgi:hypothetical protein
MYDNKQHSSNDNNNNNNNIKQEMVVAILISNATGISIAVEKPSKRNKDGEMNPNCRIEGAITDLF